MAQLCQSADEIRAASARVVLVSYGLVYQARAWQQETGACFTLLLDPTRAAYRVYGLEHSLLRSWQPKVWLQYARLMLRGRKWRGIQGDSAQLGGDFIADANGIIHLARRSHDPTDRLSAVQLLSVLKQVDGKTI